MKWACTTLPSSQGIPEVRRKVIGLPQWVRLWVPFLCCRSEAWSKHKTASGLTMHVHSRRMPSYRNLFFKALRVEKWLRRSRCRFPRAGSEGHFDHFQVILYDTSNKGTLASFTSLRKAVVNTDGHDGHDGLVVDEIAIWCQIKATWKRCWNVLDWLHLILSSPQRDALLYLYLVLISRVDDPTSYARCRFFVVLARADNSYDCQW